MSDEPRADDMDDLEMEIDWSELGLLDEPATTHNRGTCYAHATAGAITSRIQLDLKYNIYASPQQMIDCCLNGGGSNHGCCVKTLKCIKTTGVRFRTHYPTMPNPGKARGGCLDCDDTLIEMPRITIADYKVIYAPNRAQILNALLRGPIVLDIFVGPLFHAYRTKDEDDILDVGVYDEGDKTVDGVSLHSVVLMGAKKGVDGVHYYKIKNTWGPNWGFRGYAKLNQDIMTKLFLRIVYPIGVAIDWNDEED